LNNGPKLNAGPAQNVGLSIESLTQRLFVCGIFRNAKEGNRGFARPG
jgi:hypothetical protein